MVIYRVDCEQRRINKQITVPKHTCALSDFTKDVNNHIEASPQVTKTVVEMESWAPKEGGGGSQE